MDETTLGYLIMIGVLVCWFWMKIEEVKGKVNINHKYSNSMDDNNLNGKKKYYYAKSMYHSSGMLHTTLTDCYNECNQLQKKYPTEAFLPTETWR